MTTPDPHRSTDTPTPPDDWTPPDLRYRLPTFDQILDATPDGAVLTMPVQVFHEPTTRSLILFVADRHHAHGIFRAQGWTSPEDTLAMKHRIAELEGMIAAADGLCGMAADAIRSLRATLEVHPTVIPAQPSGSSSG